MSVQPAGIMDILTVLMENKRFMKILVTGAAGFLGGECARLLSEKGHQVIRTDRKPSVDLPGDLSNEDFTRRLPDVDAVLHSAGVQYFTDDLPLFGTAGYFYRNNVLATKNLTQRYAASKTHFVYVSTSMIYEQTGSQIYTPSSPRKAQGVYTESKIAAEEFVKEMSNPTATVVPCIIAGKGRAGLFAGFVSAMKRISIVGFPGKGNHPIHLVHISDAANLIVMILEQQRTGDFNAASPGPLSIEQWITEIQQELHLERIRTLHFPLAPIEFLSRSFGYHPLAKEQLLMLRYPHVLSIEESLAIGWKPQYHNAQIVRETARAL
jgi:nucleoside-diphosphate-sugar epimerase